MFLTMNFLDIQVQILEVDGLFDLKQKGYESTAWYIICVFLNFNHTHDLDPGFSRWNFENNHI